MSTTFTPQVAERSIEKTTVTEATITNLPANGTPIRATLGDSVLYGTIERQDTLNGKLVYVNVDGGGYKGFRDYPLWLASGWKFEVLGPANADADLDAELEVLVS